MPSFNVLLVEDEEHLAFSLSFNLEAEGYDVDVAPTLAEARRLFDKKHHILVLDVMLPDGSGFDLCTELRTQGVRTPILMLTAKGASTDIVTGLNAGADDYMTKPFELPELLSRIKAILRRQQWQGAPQVEDSDEATGATFSFGGNTIDFTTSEVTTASGETTEVTDLELKLIRYFIDRPDRIVTRDELLTDVWEISANTYTRTVDNFLVRLRRLFEADPQKPKHFKTVRGRGYRFIVEPDA